MIIFRGMMDIVRVVVEGVEGLGWLEGGWRGCGGGGCYRWVEYMAQGGSTMLVFSEVS